MPIRSRAQKKMIGSRTKLWLGRPDERALKVKTVKMSESKQHTPSSFFATVMGRPVIVKLNSGVQYRGMRFSRHLL